MQDLFGKATHRTLHRVQLTEKLPGLPDGRYAGIQFKSDFERKKGLWESLFLNIDTDGKWHVNTYANTINPLPFPKSKQQKPRAAKPGMTPPAVTGVNLIKDPSLENTAVGKEFPEGWGSGVVIPIKLRSLKRDGPAITVGQSKAMGNT